MSGTDEDNSLPVTYTRAEIVYSMRRMGLTPTDIAKELGIPTREVKATINKQLGRDAEHLTDEEREDMLALENARLDYYLTKLWPSIEMGDLASIREARAITHERIALNQLSMPSSTQSSQVLVISGESASYIEKLKELS